MPFDHEFDRLLRIWASIAGAVFVVVTALLLGAIVFNRGGRRPRPLFTAAKNTKVEASYALVLLVIAAGIAVGSIRSNQALSDGMGYSADAMGGQLTTVDVLAHRWCWRFNYARVRASAPCQPGQYPPLVVPAARLVEFRITSDDVVHAFWLPDFKVKRDAYPDHVNLLRMEFPQVGTWRGRCSEYCGTHHVTMDFDLHVVAPEQFQGFLRTGQVPR